MYVCSSKWEQKQLSLSWVWGLAGNRILTQVKNLLLASPSFSFVILSHLP